MNSDAKAMIGRVAKLSSELSQAFTPYEDTLTNAPQEFISEVLNHENGDVSGQAFQIECTRKLADTKLSVAEEQLLSAMQVDGRDAWGRMYDNITGALQVELKESRIGFSQAASILYGTDFDNQETAWRGIQKAMQTHQESFAGILNALAGWRHTENQKRSHLKDVHFLDTSLHDSRIQSDTLSAMMQVAKDNRHVGQKAGLLMARVHGLNEMEPWNHLAGMPSLTDGEPKVYSFDEGIDTVSYTHLRAHET